MSLWDEPYGSTEWAFKHGPWVGMDRQEWNGSPNHRTDAVCVECGYKWGYNDFRYRSHPSNPVDQHAICWNCWMLDNNPEYMHTVWGKIDGAGMAKKDSPQ